MVYHIDSHYLYKVFDQWSVILCIAPWQKKGSSTAIIWVVLIDAFKNMFIGNIIFLLLINCLLFGPSLDNWKTNQDKQQKILYNQSIIIVMSKLENIILRYSENITPLQFNNNTGVLVVNFECKEFLWNISKLKLILFLQPTLLNLPHFYWNQESWLTLHTCSHDVYLSKPSSSTIIKAKMYTVW